MYTVGTVPLSLIILNQNTKENHVLLMFLNLMYMYYQYMYLLTKTK